MKAIAHKALIWMRFLVVMVHSIAEKHCRCPYEQRLFLYRYGFQKLILSTESEVCTGNVALFTYDKINSQL